MAIQVFPDPLQLARAVVQEIIRECTEAQTHRGIFHLVLAGGNTPKTCYTLLNKTPIDWSRVHIWFSDERCLPSNDPGRNDTMVLKILLSKVPLVSKHIHHIPAERGPELAAKQYASMLENAPVMDLILLGMGEDGHTASLFPGNRALTDNRMVVPVFKAKKPPPERVSMGYSALNQARRRLIMVVGEGKRAALERIRKGDTSPIAKLATSEWFVDQAAAATSADHSGVIFCSQ